MLQHQLAMLAHRRQERHLRLQEPLSQVRARKPDLPPHHPTPSSSNLSALISSPLPPSLPRLHFAHANCRSVYLCTHGCPRAVRARRTAGQQQHGQSLRMLATFRHPYHKPQSSQWHPAHYSPARGAGAANDDPRRLQRVLRARCRALPTHQKGLTPAYNAPTLAMLHQSVSFSLLARASSSFSLSHPSGGGRGNQK